MLLVLLWCTMPVKRSSSLAIACSSHSSLMLMLVYNGLFAFSHLSAVKTSQGICCHTCSALYMPIYASA